MYWGDNHHDGVAVSCTFVRCSLEGATFRKPDRMGCSAVYASVFIAGGCRAWRKLVGVKTVLIQRVATVKNIAAHFMACSSERRQLLKWLTIGWVVGWIGG